MGNRGFDNPVWVFASDYFCRQIASATEAATFLRKWSGRRAAEHSHAISVCASALAGAMDKESAREAFVWFAEREQILVSRLSGDMLNSAAAAAQFVLH